MAGIVKETWDWFEKSLREYNEKSDTAKQRRDDQKATVMTERAKRKRDKEPTGSAWGIYE
jgi:hypothetical protein